MTNDRFSAHEYISLCIIHKEIPGSAVGYLILYFPDLPHE